MTAIAISAEVELRTLTCGGCGMTYAIPAALHRQFRQNGRQVNCPNTSCPWGGMVRRETEAMRLQRVLDDERARADRANEARRWAEGQLDHERNSHRATRGHLTRVKKRVAGGVCPCCNRTFQNLTRHMNSKHPDYAEVTE